MKRVILFTVLLLTAVGMRAQQDVSFGHYWAMEPSFNPASVGKEDKLNVAVAYAMQFAGFEHNPKTMYAAGDMPFYGLGAYLAFGALYDISEITLVIYQPRISNFSQWSLSPEALLIWAETVLRPAGEMALHGEGDFSSGPWCRFCKAKAVCRKRAEENLALARYDFARPSSLEDDEVNVILERVDSLISWANDVKEYALKRALSGYAWDNWKLVEGRPIRRFTDEKKVAEAVESAGYDPYQRKLLGITEMQKMLGKKKFNDILGEYISKPEGKPTLVSRADPRPEMNDIFNEFKEEN